MEGSRTVGKEEEKSDTEEDHWKLTDGSSEMCSTFTLPCLSIGRRELLQPFC